MRFLSAIHLSSILSLTVVAAPLTRLSRGDAAEIPRDVHIQRAQHATSGQDYDASVLAARIGADVFEDLDLTARDSEPDVEVEVNARVLSEAPKDRKAPSGGGGCVIA
ncbi:hypothetical protein FB451DRAFT_1373234 [Mycena latifolia]|nr:hypothetical protein FB451DRAFT_1373234 [Mycena latifolia]